MTEEDFIRCCKSANEMVNFCSGTLKSEVLEDVLNLIEEAKYQRENNKKLRNQAVQH
jgi:hypothetical protein